MKAGFDVAPSSAPTRDSIPLTPIRRAITIAALVLVAFPLGFVMEVSVLVMTLGLLNIAIIVFLLLQKDITWGFLFYLTAVIFFQTGFWIRLPGFPDLYPARIASMLLYLIFLIQILLSMREVPRLGAVEYSMIIFIVVLIISLVTSGQKIRWAILLRGYLYPFLFFYFARSVIKGEHQIKILMGYLMFLGIYLGAMGIFEKFRVDALVWPKIIIDESVRNEGLSRVGFRVRGIFLQPAVLGVVMTMGFYPAWIYLQRLKGIIPWILRLVLLGVTPLTIFFTQTRSVYAGFAASLLVGAFCSRKLRMLCIGMLLALMVGLFVNWEQLSSEDRDAGGMGQLHTVHYRINVLYEAFDIFMDHPFFGCGFFNFQELAFDYRRPRDVPFFGHIDIGVGGHAVSHNMLATVLAEQGMFGVIPYVLIFFFVLRTSFRAAKVLPREGVVSYEFVVCVWIAMTAYFVNAMSLEFRYFEYPNVLYFFLMGAMVGMYEHYLKDRAAAGLSAPAEPEKPSRFWRLTPRTGGAA